MADRSERGAAAGHLHAETATRSAHPVRSGDIVRRQVSWLSSSIATAAFPESSSGGWRPLAASQLRGQLRNQARRAFTGFPLRRDTRDTVAPLDIGVPSNGKSIYCDRNGCLALISQEIGAWHGFFLCRPCSGTRRSNAGLLGGSLPTIAAEKEGAIRYLSPGYDLASTLLCVGSEPTRPRPGVREPSKASLELGPAQPSHYPSRCTPSFISPLDFLMEPDIFPLGCLTKTTRRASCAARWI